MVEDGRLLQRRLRRHGRDPDVDGLDRCAHPQPCVVSSPLQQRGPAGIRTCRGRTFWCGERGHELAMEALEERPVVVLAELDEIPRPLPRQVQQADRGLARHLHHRALVVHVRGEVLARQPAALDARAPQRRVKVAANEEGQGYRDRAKGRVSGKRVRGSAPGRAPGKRRNNHEVSAPIPAAASILPGLCPFVSAFTGRWRWEGSRRSRRSAGRTGSWGRGRRRAGACCTFPGRRRAAAGRRRG